MMTDYRRRLFSNFFSLGIIQGTNFLLPIVVMPFVIRRIGADGFGVVAIAQVVMMFFTNISDYGFNLTATRDVSLNKHNREALSRIFFLVLVTRLLICVLLFAVLLVSIWLIPALRPYSSLYLLAFTTVVGQSILMNWLFQGLERMKYIMYISLLARIIFVILVVAFIKTKADNIYFIFFTGLGNLLAGMLSIILAIRLLHLKLLMPGWGTISHELRNGWHITVSNLSVSTYMYINVLVLRIFSNDAVVGYYSIAEKIILACRQILSVYFQGIYPQVCQLALTSKQALLRFFRSYFLPFLGMVLAGCFVLFFFSTPIVGIFIGSHQAIPALYLRIMSFVPFIICLNIPAYQVLLAFHEKRILLLVFILGTSINLLMNVLLVKHWGALGTSYIVCITETLISFGLIYGVLSNAKTSVIKQKV